MSLDTFRNFVVFSELLAAIIGTIYFYKYKHTPLKYFLPLLWYITITEFTGWYASENRVFGFFDEKNRLYTLWMYNLLYFILFNVLFYIYSKSLKIITLKKWVNAFMAIYSFISIVNWSFLQSFIYEKSETPRAIGSILLITSIIFYLIELLKSERISIYHKKLLFWISIGLLIFFSGTLPFSLKYNGYALMPEIHNLFLIIWVLAIIMYLTFAFGFIWSDKEEKIE